MLEAALWGAVAASSLLVGMAIALAWTPPKVGLGLVLAFGAGALFSAIAFDLADSAIEHGSERLLAAGMLLGAGVYVGGSMLLRAKTDSGIQPEGDEDSRSIVLGATLDGIPESLAIGASVAAASGSGAAISLTLPVAVALSNLPEAMGATAGMKAAKHSTGKIIATWVGLVVASAIAAGIGYVVLSDADERVSAILDAFTAGAVLAMVADTMTPDAYRDAGRTAGIATVVGFALSLLIS